MALTRLSPGGFPRTSQTFIAKGESGDLARVVDDAVGLTESTHRAIIGVRMSDDAIALTETTGRARTMVRVVNESVGITEEIVDILYAGLIVQVVNEAIGITDAELRNRVMARVVADAISLTDAVLTYPDLAAAALAVDRDEITAPIATRIEHKVAICQRDEVSCER